MSTNLTTTFAPLTTIISWFAENAVPTDKQFETTWKSFFHKSENIPVEQIYQLAEILNLKAERDHMHFDLAKKDGSNLSVEDINGLKEVLGVALAANGIINNIETTITSADANLLQDGIYKPKTTGVYAAIGLTAKENYTTLFKKLDGVWSVFSEEEMPMQKLSTFSIEDSNSSVSSFKNIVKNIYINDKGGNYDFRFIYIIKNEVRGKLGIIISRVDPTSQTAEFYLPMGYNIEPNKIYKLIPKDDHPLNELGLEMWIETNNFENFGSDVFTTFIYNSTFSDLALNYKPIELIYEKSLGTFSYLTANSNEATFYSLIEDIYIVDSNRKKQDTYSINYIWLNRFLGIFGFQVLKNNEAPTNFYLKDVKSNGVQKLMKEIADSYLSSVDVYVKFKDFGNFPTIQILQTNINTFYFNDKSFSLELNTLSSKNIVNNEVLAEAWGDANSIQRKIDGIKDATKDNPYTIKVSKGLYKVTNSSQFIGNPQYPAMIVPKDYINIEGENKEDCVVWAELPYSDAEIDTSIPRTLHQTIYNWAECTISNIKFVGKFLRYTLHQDNPKETNKTRTYINCDFIFLGDKGYLSAMGIGTYSGSKTYVKYGRSFSEYIAPFAVHNNQNFSKPSLWSFDNHTFATIAQNNVINLQNSGSRTSDILELNNCKFEGGFILDYQELYIYTPNLNESFNHSNWRVIGSNNQPLYFKNNTLLGKGLKIEAKEVGKRVRFDKNSSAYGLIIANNSEYYGNIGHPERKIIDQYIVHDYITSFNSYAIGCKSIQEDNYPEGTKISQDGLGKRLGDCSATNKILGVFIGTETYNVVFNKNYTNMTNAQIIAEINTALGVNGVASEYIIGRDYYAELTDVNFILSNNSSVPILKGSLVTLEGNGVRLATENDIVFGVAIDDIEPSWKNGEGIYYGFGRIIKNAIFNKDELQLDNQVVIEKGKRYKSNNGKLIQSNDGNLIGFRNDFLLI